MFDFVKTCIIFKCFLCFTVLSAQEPKLVVPTGPSFMVDHIEFSADDNKIITADSKTLYLWDVRTGALLNTYFGSSISASFVNSGELEIDDKNERVLRVCDLLTSDETVFDYGKQNIDFFEISPTGDFGIATLKTNKSDIFLFKFPTLKLIRKLGGDGTDINELKFSKDGSRVMSFCFDSTVRVWDSNNGELLNIFKLSSILSFGEIAGDNTRLITSEFAEKGFGYVVKIWNILSGTQLKLISCDNRSVSPDGRTMAVASSGLIQVFYTATGDLLSEFGTGSKNIISLCFSQNNLRLITNSVEGDTKIWDLNTQAELSSFSGGHKGAYISIFNENEDKLATAYIYDPVIKLWDTQSKILLTELRTHSEKIEEIWTSDEDSDFLTHVTNGSSIKTWNIMDGSFKYFVKDNNNALYNCSISPKKKWVVAVEKDKGIVIWNKQTGVRSPPLLIHMPVVSYSISPNDSLIALSFAKDSVVRIYNLFSGIKMKEISTGKSGFSITFSTDGNNLIFDLSDKIKIWNIFYSKWLLTISKNGHMFWNFTSCSISPDGQYLVTPRSQKCLILVSIAQQKIISDSLDHSKGIFSAEFSPDSKMIVTASEDKTVKVWSAITGRLLYTTTEHSDYVYFARFSPDNKKIITGSLDDTARIWGINPFQLLSSFYLGKNFQISTIDFNKNQIIAQFEGEMAFFDMATGINRYSLFEVDSSDYLFKIAGGYYLCTPNAAKQLHYVTKDMKVVTFEQLDLKYNRPDKVLRVLSKDTQLIGAYTMAYYKRLKRSGIDTTLFKGEYSVPEVDFSNRDSIAYEQKVGQLKLVVHGIDSLFAMTRFNIWINKIPIFGSKGIPIKVKAGNAFDTVITARLTAGDNKIEVSILNANGCENYRAPLFVKYISPIAEDNGKLIFVGIGISRFKDSRNNLKWSVKDIRDLAFAFKNKYGKKCEIDTFFDEQVTEENIASLKKIFYQTDIDDKVIIAYSGHGILNKDYNYYLSTYNINFDDPAPNGISYELFENLMDSIPARKKLMLIDACNSGEIDKEEMIEYRKVQSILDKTKGFAAFIPRNKKILGIKNTFALMQRLFVDIGKNTGATIISAAAGTQFALERDNLRNSVFTFSILEFLNSHETATINQLKNYVNNRVVFLTNGAQMPTERSENTVIDWQIW